MVVRCTMIRKIIARKPSKRKFLTGFDRFEIKPFNSLLYWLFSLQSNKITVNYIT